MNNRTIKFRAWDKDLGKMFFQFSVRSGGEIIMPSGVISLDNSIILMQYTGLKDENGKEIYEGDIIGKKGVYHFIDRQGWEPEKGQWKIIGEKIANFIGEEEEKYIEGYELQIVEWKNSSCGFEPFSDSQENCGCCGEGCNPGGIEVIGNIYENPELIK